ncbi:hypothetical protein J6590_066130 [Homalodisca vitripennis]|nr:hypothetical protein J6590_066130 [Homalodisca vitripennis]
MADGTVDVTKHNLSNISRFLPAGAFFLLLLGRGNEGDRPITKAGTRHARRVTKSDEIGAETARSPAAYGEPDVVKYGYM